MSAPSASSSSSGSSSRRAPAKTGRKQYTACGACRLRRVKCDLRNLQEAAADGSPQVCTNCSERGINCIDEYLDIKAARRQSARSFQSIDGDGAGRGSRLSSPSSPSYPHTPSPIDSSISLGGAIPQPHPDFFRSTFFRQLSLQYPIFDRRDFIFLRTEVPASNNGVSIERRVLAMVLVGWAASFGLDECAVKHLSSGSGMVKSEDHDRASHPRSRTDALISGVLKLIDTHALLRNPSWDGVRILLLLWPLTQGVQRSLERITAYETILSHIHALCRLGTSGDSRSSLDTYNEPLSRARVFWYAYTNEGVTNGLRGGRLMLNNDDLENFQGTLPSSQFAPTTAYGVGAASTAFSAAVQAMADSRQQPQSRSFLLYQLTSHHFDIVLHIGAVCRHIHATLTSPRALQATNDPQIFNEAALKTIWDGIDRCWDEIESCRGSGLWNATADEVYTVEDVDVFASSWQIFLFECHNVVRESLKQRLVARASAERASTTSNSPSSLSYGTMLLNMHMHATARSQITLPVVLSLLRRHLVSPSRILLRYDSGRVRDGISSAGFMLAQSDFEGFNATEVLQRVMTPEEGVDVCLRALGEMDWTFANSKSPQQALSQAWEERQSRNRQRYSAAQSYQNNPWTSPQAASSQQWTAPTEHQQVTGRMPPIHTPTFSPYQQAYMQEPMINPDFEGASASGVRNSSNQYTDPNFSFYPGSQSY